MQASGRKIGLRNLDPVGMQRPMVKRLRLAEFPLCQFRGLILGQRVNFQRTLTDFRLSAVFAKHILHEANDKP
jgi:hypothetical protein